MSYATDRRWADRYIPTIKLIVGPHLLCEAPLEVDQQQAADLIVMRAKDMTIACRVRRAGYAQSFPFDVTFRSRRDNGTKTELAKIIDGWADWMFYGHASNDKSGEIGRWFLIDLAKLRAHLIRVGIRGKEVFGQEMPNGDGTWFVPLNLRSVLHIVIASSEHIEEICADS